MQVQVSPMDDSTESALTEARMLRPPHEAGRLSAKFSNKPSLCEDRIGYSRGPAWPLRLKRRRAAPK
jgi:hypothetical protein